jgi:hypothetical protein
MTNYMGKHVHVEQVVKEYSFFPSSNTITNNKVKISVVLYQKQESYLLQNNAGQHPPTGVQLVPCIRSKLQSRKENSTPIHV